MDHKEFFAAVCKMRKLQKHREQYGHVDQLSIRECKKQEELIDMEIKRVEQVLREKAQPRFFDL